MGLLRLEVDSTIRFTVATVTIIAYKSFSEIKYRIEKKSNQCVVMQTIPSLVSIRRIKMKEKTELVDKSHKKFFACKN